MKIRAGAALLLAGIFLLGGCGSVPAEGGSNPSQPETGGNKSMGRFIDQEVTLPEGTERLLGISQADGSLRISEATGRDIVSTDAGAVFQYAEDIPQAFMEMTGEGKYMDAAAVAADGTRLVSFAEASGEDILDLTYYRYLVKADNQVIDMQGKLPSDSMEFFCGSDGNFYAASYGDHSIYKIDPASGNVEFLFQTERIVSYMNVCGNYLFAVYEDHLVIFDREKKELAQTDTTLDEFLAGQLKNFYSGNTPVMLYPSQQENGIYVVTEKGLYYHVMYGNVMEQLIDGSLSSIGDSSKHFVGMAVIRGSGEKEDFLIAFTDGTAVKCVYDESIPTVPDTTLRVYSLYEDGNVKLAVSAFKRKHTDLYVKYETGLTGDNGMTVEDALSNLSTELAAGKGPDILFMDGLPYDSYVEKGILADLSELAATMTEEEAIFDNIADNYVRDGKRYVIPAVFSIPLLSGEEDKLNGLTTLSGLADVLEAARAQQPTGSLISFVYPRAALQLLAQASAGAWTKEDGSLDKEAVTDFLTQTKRIYDAQMSGIGESEQQIYDRAGFNTSGGLDITASDTYTDSDINSMQGVSFILKQPFTLGYFSGNMSDYSFYVSLLHEMKQNYILMPGQMKNACIPSALAAVNSATKVKDQADEFVKYMLSLEFQGDAGINSMPMNKAAYSKKEIYWGANEDEAYGSMAIDSDTGGKSITVYWPNKAEKEKLRGIADNIATVNSDGGKVYDAVMEYGEAALKGEQGIEETVNEIEKKVQLYLAE